MAAVEDTRHLDSSAFVREALRIVGPAEPGDVALDLPCGAGRHARHLADLGYRVIGADIDQSCLETARRESVLQADAIEWRQLDARAELPFAIETFAVAAVVDYVDLDLLPRLVTLLKPGGYLIFQTFSNRGGNWTDLPKAGQAKHAVVDARALRYRERAAGPAEVDRVTVRGLWQRDG
ncbi:class I SAM-dependent methyltransferase [Salinisphaera hydrothermalis]|uniref:class I SAM-dependent methyltransferase n=1 Tax=Salinisphaera hydrothermalis TaxID=563188 RepID=UPI00333E9BA9